MMHGVNSKMCQSLIIGTAIRSGLLFPGCSFPEAFRCDRAWLFVWQENSELREKVAVGEVRASQLCRMQSFDMATKERQEEFEKLQVRRLMMAVARFIHLQCILNWFQQAVNACMNGYSVFRHSRRPRPVWVHL